MSGRRNGLSALAAHCALAALAVTAFTACDLGAPVERAPAGTISGAIRYDGAARGTLFVEAYATMPPSGPPLAGAAVPDARFPQAYTLEGLSAGDVFLVARLVDDAGSAPALGTFPSVLSVSPVVLDDAAGLRGADFDVVDEGTRPEGPIAMVGARTLSGVVRWSGTAWAQDVLRGALYRSYPASGPPADLMILNVESPSFPFSYDFVEVRDGSYFTVFYLDRGGDNPFGPGPGDVVAWALGPDGEPVGAAVTLGAGTGGVDVALGE